MRTPGRDSRQLSAALREEAIEWFVSFCEAELDLGGREAFLAWLRRSPEHVRAYLQIMAFWEDAEALQAHARHGMDVLVKRAAEESNIVIWRRLADGKAVPLHASRTGRKFWRATAMAVTVGAIALLSFALIPRAPTIETGVGEQRVVTLADGSRVELNARSRVRIRYSPVRREVDLLEGQALFKVAKDPRRPFLVFSDGAVVRAVGTQFDMNRTHDTTVITVVEGSVAVSDVGDGSRSGSDALGNRMQSSSAAIAPAAVPIPASVYVSSGQRVIAFAHKVAPPEAANPEVATAWTQGKLIFDSVALKDVIEEFNRYLPQPLVLDDPQLQSLHISGVFAVTESQQLVEFLHQRFGTTSREEHGNIRIVRP